MKLLLAMTCLLIYANCVSSHGIRAKRGFSEAQQKKFIDAVNRDRRKIEKVTGVKMVPLTYYSELERRAEVLDCHKELRGDVIQFDSVGRELYEIARKNRETMLPEIFDPAVTEIGCAKKNCDHKVNANFIGPSLKPFIGKKIIILGLCMTDLPGYAFYHNKSFVETLHRTILPPPFAYGDILGIPTGNQESGVDGTDGKQGSGVEMTGKNGADGEQGSGAGSVFSLIISLFLVLYI